MLLLFCSLVPRYCAKLEFESDNLLFRVIGILLHTASLLIRLKVFSPKNASDPHDVKFVVVLGGKIYHDL